MARLPGNRMAAVLAWSVLPWRRRRAAEKAMREQLHHIEILSRTIPLPICVRDAQGRMLSCSASYETSVGIAASAMLGKTAAELPAHAFESAPEFHRAYLHVLRTGEPLRQRRRIVAGNARRWVDHWVSPYRDDTGSVAGLICGWFDRTEEHRLIERLAAASQSKTAFLATMSHEIRTPLNAVMGTLELALERARDGVFDRASIEAAYASGRGLLDLIGDILDIARIESGNLVLAPRRTSVREEVEAASAAFERLALRKGIHLAVEIEASADCCVYLDAGRFRQILSNLVSNAIKFTERGTVTITVGATPVGEVRLQLMLQVKDTGIGISVADQQRLFQPFAQVQCQHGTTGSGLGLAICRSLCALMGGTLRLDSAPGEGTRVVAEVQAHRLPAAASAPALAEPVTPATPPRRLTVLVADDHPPSRQLLLRQLGHLGHDAVFAGNGADALALWKSREIDAVITDCRMPLLDGAGLARAIRLEERRLGRPPCTVLGVTADAQPPEIERAIDAGMDDCLVKPVGLAVLRSRLATLVRDPGNSASRP